MTPRAGRIRQATSLVDQCTHAGIAMGCMVAFGRWLGVDDFGALMAGYAIWFLAESLQRSAILIPAIISISKHVDAAGAYATWFRVGFIAVAASSGLMLAGVPVAHYFVAEYWQTALAAGAVFTFTGGINSLARRLFFHSAAYKHILIGDGLALLLFGIMATAIVSPAKGAGLSVASALLTYGILFSAAPVFLALAGWRLVFATPLPFKSVLAGNGAFIRQLSAGSLAQYLYNNGVQLLLAIVSTPIGVAAFSASRTMARPLFIVTSAYSDAERSQAAKQFAASGAPGLDRMFWPMMRTLALVFGPILIIFAAIAPWMMHVAFDGKYDDYAIHSILWIAALAPQIFAFPSDIILTTRGDSRHLMRSRFEAAGLCLLFFFAGYLVMSDVPVAWAIISIIAARLWLLARNSLRYASTRTSSPSNESMQ